MPEKELDTSDPFIATLLDDLRNGTSAITRIQLLPGRPAYFTRQFQGDEVLVSQDLAKALARALHKDLVVIPGPRYDVLATLSEAALRFSAIDWTNASEAGSTQLTFQAWQLKMAATLEVYASKDS